MTITIETKNKSITKAVIAFCQALGIKNYTVSPTAAEIAAKADYEARLAETREAVDAHLRGDREGAIMFNSAAEARQYFGL